MCNRNWFHNQDDFPIEWEHEDEETAFLEERFYSKERDKVIVLPSHIYPHL